MARPIVLLFDTAATVFWRRMIYTYCVQILSFFLRSWRFLFATLLAKLYTNRVSYIKIEIIPGPGAILLAPPPPPITKTMA